MTQNQQPTDMMDLEAAFARECSQILSAFIRNAFDAVVDKCYRRINAGGKAFAK